MEITKNYDSKQKRPKIITKKWQENLWSATMSTRKTPNFIKDFIKGESMFIFNLSFNIKFFLLRNKVNCTVSLAAMSPRQLSWFYNILRYSQSQVSLPFCWFSHLNSNLRLQISRCYLCIYQTFRWSGARLLNSSRFHQNVNRSLVKQFTKTTWTETRCSGFD